jgi:hypothetical protein
MSKARLFNSFNKKSVDIYSLYDRLDRSIKVLSANIKDKNMIHLIKACRYKPLKFLSNKKTNELLYTDWIDEFNHVISFSKKRGRFTQFKDYYYLNAERNITTDMYYGLDVYKIHKISTRVYCVTGFSEIDDSLNIYLCFLGIDGFLRAFWYFDGEWLPAPTNWMEPNKILSLLGFGKINIKCKVMNIKGKFPFSPYMETLLSVQNFKANLEIFDDMPEIKFLITQNT